MKRLIFVFVFLSVVYTSYGVQLNVFAGVDGWRHDTGIEDSAKPGGNMGFELLFSPGQGRLLLGGGGEYKSHMRGLNNDENYSPIFVFVTGKIFLGATEIYLLGRGGYSYNDNGSRSADNGPYISAGVGYNFTNIYSEVVYELFDIRDNGDLFHNGTMQMVGVKVGYKF